MSAGGDGSLERAMLQGKDPATGQPLPGSYPEATLDEIDDRVMRASAAAARLRNWTGAERSRLLEAMAAELRADAEPIVSRAGAETALPRPRLEGELTRTVNQLRMFAALAAEGSWVDARIDRAQPQRQPMPRPDLRRMLRPIGVVAVFAASNFPLAFSVAGGDTASALAAGNPVVLKAHPGHPGTSALVADALARAIAACGLGDGVLSVIHGASHAVGVSLLQHPRVCAGAFTGSTKGGRALMGIAAQRAKPIPFFAEMGSVNPQFILPGALAERPETLAEGLHRSLTLGVGQFCTNPGVTHVVDGPGIDRFLDRLKRLVQGTPTGTMLNASIGTAYRAGLERITELDGIEALARVDSGPGRGDADAGAAVFIVDAASYRDHPRLEQELFGPFGLIVRSRSVDEVAAAIGRCDGQLTATVHMAQSDAEVAARLLPMLSEIAGRVLVNDYPTGVEVSPAMHHGGPFPATSDPRFTSVGTAAIQRFARPICYQNLPASLLPPELRDENPLGIQRLIDGSPTRAAC